MSAIISECGRYRYRLERDVAQSGCVFAYFGINPSTADAEIDDATVRKWRGFTLRNGGRRFIVGNVFSYRATDVRDIVLDPNPAFSLENQRHLKAITMEADVLVPCWGSRGKVPSERRHIIDEVMALLTRSGKPVMHFGLTKSGDPKHPLMLGYETTLSPWSRP